MATAVVVTAITALLAVVATVIALAVVLRAALFGLGRCRSRCAAIEHALEPAHQANACCGGRHRGCDGAGGGNRSDGFTFFTHGGGLRVFHVGHGWGGRNIELGLGQRMHRQLARRVALVAGTCGFFAQFVLAHACDFVVRGMQGFIGHDDDRCIMARLDLAQRTALLVEQEVGDVHRGLDQHLPGVFLHRVLFGHADDGQRQRFDAAHAAVAFALRTHDLAGFTQRGTQALAAHFHQAEA